MYLEISKKLLTFLTVAFMITSRIVTFKNTLYKPVTERR